VDLERLLQRDRLILGVGLVVLALLAWIYTYGLVGGAWPSLMAMPQRHGWTASDVILTVIMWVVMMTAMMTPSVSPAILLLAGVERRRGAPHPALHAGLALGGYLFVWGAISVIAALAQWGLHDAALLDGPMGRLSPRLAGIVLIGIGLYQWTPVKALCLTRCRSPVDTLGHFWRPGVAGAFALGLRHGLYCLGCCWALMIVLYVTGVMNLLWVALLSILVLIEKLLRRGPWLGKGAGLAIAAWGLLLLAGYAL
jgi:predicted metal-binding membrane protein